MKRTFLLLAAVCLLLSACSRGPKRGDAFDGVIADEAHGITMAAEDPSAGGVTLAIMRTAEAEIYSGNAAVYSLQQEADGVWYVLERQRELVTTAEAVGYPRDETVRQELSWGSDYGSLPAGHYRVVKSFWSEEEDLFLLAAEFTLILSAPA